MSTDSYASALSDVGIASSADAFDTSLHFDRWLQELQGGQEPLATQKMETYEVEDSDIYFGSFPGSVCELTFEGVLHLDGYSIGDVTSPEGTLMLGKRGRLEGDVRVRVAVIRGCVIGDITASEGVVLESEASVAGEIRTPALSVRWGASIDGDWLSEPNTTPLGQEEDEAEEPRLLAMGAAA
jgi:cytoskeletal protein CcmA (bactofilin family)